MIVKKTLPRILICDDDQNIHLAIKTALGKDYDFKSAYNGDEAILILKKNPIDIVLLDMEMRTASEGLDTIPRILETQGDAIVIVTVDATIDPIPVHAILTPASGIFFCTHELFS